MESSIAIGKVRRPHGLAGAFKVLSFSGQYDHFALPEIYCLKNGNRSREFSVEWVKVSGERTLVKLKGLDSPEQVKPYSNWEIWVQKRFAVPIENADEYYYADLIGLNVLCNGLPVGSVTAVYQDLIDDTLEVTMADTGKKVLVPFRSLFVGRISPKEGVIEITEEWFFNEN